MLMSNHITYLYAQNGRITGTSQLQVAQFVCEKISIKSGNVGAHKTHRTYLFSIQTEMNSNRLKSKMPEKIKQKCKVKV